ncbi:MAG TPA: excinuclease ABC subunit UvrC [Thermoanaerobaculia bacterium]|nr:excinuclease ABC subunit UvrC [Thermoanaerobaculia bacterium]
MTAPMSLAAHVEQRIRDLPDRPGIYIFKGKDGRPLYVGKAKSLRKRAASYLGSGHEARIAAMLSEARDLESLVTDSEAEALLLENNWIKRKRPRYNVLLRDDKTYPYLKLTAHPYPRLGFTRRVRDDGADYFGPYLPAGLARQAIKLVQKLFKVRVCTIDVDGSLPRPCLYYDMNRCLGPCVEGLTTAAAYASAVEEARLFLSGRTDELVRRLRRDMEGAANELRFEEAARLRDVLTGIETVTQRRKLSSVVGDDVDTFGVHTVDGNAAVVVLVMRGGQVLDRRELFWEGRESVSPRGILSELLPQVYERTPSIPKEVHLPFAVEGEQALLDWLSERKGERVYGRHPARGPKAQRVALAMKNAQHAFRRRFRSLPLAAEAGEALARHLELLRAPRRIEGFDISNLQGRELVASMVVWEEGKMRRSEYRKMNIRGLPGQDDFASMRQAVERRYRRRLEEVGEMPDLILIDGGRGQLNAALDALAKLGVEETPIVSLAKREEEIYLPGHPEPLRLPRRDAGLRLLQRVRDEAHRFAVAHHRSRRRSANLHSALDDLQGIGPVRRRLLLDRFGSLAGVKSASRQELQEALGEALGERVYIAIRSP